VPDILFALFAAGMVGGGWWHQPMPATHINPPVMIVSPIRKSAVSNRVIVQSCRIMRLNRWTANEQDGPQLFNGWLARLCRRTSPRKFDCPERGQSVSGRISPADQSIG